MKGSSECFWTMPLDPQPLTHWALPVEKYHLRASCEGTNLSNRVENEITVDAFTCAISGNYQKWPDKVYGGGVIFLYSSQESNSQWFILIKITLFSHRQGNSHGFKYHAKITSTSKTTLLSSDQVSNSLLNIIRISQIPPLSMTQMGFTVFTIFPPNPYPSPYLSEWHSHLSQ